MIEHSTPLAARLGSEILALPEDLYIPPDALRVFLETFEGPLDLLLYLIKKQNIDIVNIPIAQITEQYLQYVNTMQGLRFELAAEYLLMAAMLAEIKSRMLLPQRNHEDSIEEDPRAELVRRLQEYEQFRKAAERLDDLPQEGRDVFTVKIQLDSDKQIRPQAPIELSQLLFAFKEVMNRATLYEKHQLITEPLSVRERMSGILSQIQHKQQLEFYHLFDFKEGRLGVVVTFLAILELSKQALIEIKQDGIFTPIFLISPN